MVLFGVVGAILAWCYIAGLLITAGWPRNIFSDLTWVTAVVLGYGAGLIAGWVFDRLMVKLLGQLADFVNWLLSGRWFSDEEAK